MQTHTAESQDITGKPSASLAQIYFGGVNLSEAIKGSSHVAKPQQLKSVMSVQEYVDTVENHPLLLRNTAQYAQDLINREGVQQKTKYGRPILEYNFFPIRKIRN